MQPEIAQICPTIYNLILRYVLSLVKSGRNVFFTGGAGTGKSFLVQKIIGVILT